MYYAFRMMNVENICDTIGRKRLADTLGVSKAAITNAISDKKFPPRWYRVVLELCRESEVECHDGLFAFIDPPEAAKERAEGAT